MSKEMIASAGKQEVVELAMLKVDHTYQRDVKRHAGKIAREFVASAAMPLMIARRIEDKSLWIIDGQQRVTAMTELGITHWRAVVVDSSGPEFEARLYSTINGGSGTTKGLNVRDLFKARLAAGDPIAHEAIRAIKAGGLELSLHGSQDWPHLACVGAIYSHVRVRGSKVVETAATLIAQHWAGSDYALQECMFSAMVLICEQPQTDTVRLGKVMEKNSAMRIWEKAQSTIRGHKTARAYTAIAEIYNKGIGKKTPLPESLKVFVENKENKAENEAV